MDAITIIDILLLHIFNLKPDPALHNNKPFRLTTVLCNENNGRRPGSLTRLYLDYLSTDWTINSSHSLNLIQHYIIPDCTVFECNILWKSCDLSYITQERLEHKETGRGHFKKTTTVYLTMLYSVNNGWKSPPARH